MQSREKSTKSGEKKIILRGKTKMKTTTQNEGGSRRQKIDKETSISIVCRVLIQAVRRGKSSKFPGSVWIKKVVTFLA